MIRLAVPPIEEDDLRAVRDALASGYLVQDVRVEAFEQKVASYVGAKHAVAVSNCTAALHLGLLALDVRPGDIVLVTAYSWIATANVIELCGAEPVFVDIRPDTLRAILPVHAFGQMADMPGILEVANRYDLPVVEDAACALGATLNDRQAGTWGRMGCFSFHPRKAITTGEGGVVATDDPALAHRMRVLRNHGQDSEAAAPDFIVPGFNYRMTEFQAALGLTQMAKLDRVITSRRRLAAAYEHHLTNTSLRPPYSMPGSRPVYQSYVTMLPDQAIPRRQSIIQQLRERGIETTIGTWHIPLTTFFRTRYGYRPGDFPVADHVFAATLTLPLHERLSGEDQEQVICQAEKAIRDAE
jgi:dTDP-4-amino-4,6-dideoxygalactose transaminase